MIIVKLLMFALFIFLVIKAIKFGIKKNKQIDRDFDVKERMETIQEVDKSAKEVDDYKVKNADTIKNQKDNEKTINDFKNGVVDEPKLEPEVVKDKVS